MTQIDIIKECQICSEVSQANGEALIGSAGNYNHFLFVEMAEPWARNFVYEHPQLGAIYAMAEDLEQEQVNIRVMAIAPDYHHSNSNLTRVLHYQRPTGQFARFEKQEFLIPHEKIMSLAIALLKQPSELSQFDAYRQQTNHIRDMMFCTHGSYDLACGRFGYPLYRQLRSEYAANAESRFRVWRCSHLGPHNFAPLLVDLPEGRYWGHLKPEILPLLVQRNGSVAKLYPFYVGWAGLEWAEQIAEREIWMQEGWDWINYHKSGQTLAIDPSDEDYPDWAEVRIDFSSPDGTTSGAYEARIEANRTVKTMWTSGKDQPLWEVKQYHVSRLDKSV